MAVFDTSDILTTGLTVNGQTILSGNSSNNILTISGSTGELLKVTDVTSATLFSIGDASGNPILQILTGNTILLGDSTVPELKTTTKSTVTTTNQTLFSISTSSYSGAIYDYVVSSTTNVRAGTVISAWDGTNIEYTEFSTNDLGDTAPLTFSMTISGGNAILRASASSGSWTVKIMLRTI